MSVDHARRELDCDLLVVGGGAAGLAGAVTAAYHGLKVIVAEKAPVLGGATSWSGGWMWAPLNPLYEAGEFAEAADRGRELVATYPQYAGPLYNLACCESLAGRPADAVEHLGQAIARSERFRAYAQDDSDFDAIRDEPAFKALVAGTAQET